jgi:hypothetical protein
MNSSEKVRVVSSNSCEQKKTGFHKMVITFHSGVHFARYLYHWKGIYVL